MMCMRNLQDLCLHDVLLPCMLYKALLQHVKCEGDVKWELRINARCYYVCTEVTKDKVIEVE